MSADDFNSRHPVGTPVFAYPGARPEDYPQATRLVTKTRSRASVLGGHTDVVWVDGHSACIALTHVDVVTGAEYEAALLEDAAAELGALPMPVPVVPEPQALSVERLQLRVDEVERKYTFDTAELKRQLESARALGVRVIHAEQRRAELEAVLGTHRKDDQAEVDRLRARVAELLAERQSTNEALDDAVQALRADLAMVCRVCEAPVRWVDSPTGGWWNHVTPTEDGHGLTPKPVFVPRTERSYWVAIADALNAAHSAGMPVGIDLDGTLTDHNAWSVVWDRSADRWAVAGYEDGFPAPDAAARKTFAECAARESDSGRRAAWRMLADSHDLPETGGAR